MLAIGGLARGGLDGRIAGQAILLAAAANMPPKIAIAILAGGRRFAASYVAASLAALAAGVIAFLSSNFGAFGA